MSTTTDILAGCADYLTAQGVAVYVAGAPYASSQVGIVFARLPQQPDRVVMLNTYPVSDHPTQSLSRVGLQVVTRGVASDPLGPQAVRDAAFDALQGLTGVQWGSVSVVQILRHHGVAMGQDDDLRFLFADSYYLDCNPAPTGLRDL